MPQQFPRRLYEMLEKETVLSETTSRKVISWSDSGKAFRIWDADEFAKTVLPKYFRTAKFSSFQRNLNLYGFCKIRRGPDQDMYAHSYFQRNEPDGLFQLRKTSTRGGTTTKAGYVMAALEPQPETPVVRARTTSSRVISPSTTSSWSSCTPTMSGSPGAPLMILRDVIFSNPSSVKFHAEISSGQQETLVKPFPKPDCRRLDLLAFALEHEGAYAALATL